MQWHLKRRAGVELLDQTKVELTIEEKLSTKIEETNLKYSEKNAKKLEIMGNDEGKQENYKSS